jgi:8-oxo-dGTP diphosphatase
MSRNKPVELTNLCLIYDDDRILVQERVWNGEKGIIFPGGHVEDGESMLAAVTREMKEETGLDIRNPRLCGIKEWINEDGSRYVVFLFRAEEFSGELVSSEEGRVFWMEKEDVLKSRWIWHMDCLMKIIADGEFTELYLDSADDWKPVLK